MLRIISGGILSLIWAGFAIPSPARAADAPATANSAAAQKSTDRVTEINAADPSSIRPWRGSETVGLQVDNSQGEHLGKIEDVVYNPATGHIRFAILSFDGLQGVEKQYFAVPWKHLRAGTKTAKDGGECCVLVLDIDKAKLKNAPGFDPKRWPDFTNQAYSTSVDEFYADNAPIKHTATNAN